MSQPSQLSTDTPTSRSYPARQLPERRPRRLVVADHASTTSASASCTWSAVLLALPAGRHLRACSAHRAADARAAPSWTRNTYNRMFTLHGVVMIFLFMIPAIPARVRQLHAAADAGRQGRRLPAAQPAVASTSTWPARRSRSAGMITGGTDTGWTFYAPYSTHDADDGGRRCCSASSSSASRRSSPASTSSSPSTRCARRA